MLRPGDREHMYIYIYLYTYGQFDGVGAYGELIHGHGNLWSL